MKLIKIVEKIYLSTIYCGMCKKSSIIIAKFLKICYNIIGDTMNKQTVYIQSEYIKLGQFLKYIDLASGALEIKYILANSKILVNGNAENRRGAKLYPGYDLNIDGQQYLIVNET